MPEFSSYQPGMPSWVDLATSDLEGARAFYGGLFGWEFDIRPNRTRELHHVQGTRTERGRGRRRSRGRGHADGLDHLPAWRPTMSPPGRDAAKDSVGGAVERGDVPAHWMPYFGVADADAAVAAVTRLGGTVERPAVDAPFGRNAVARDPQGAILTLLQVPAQQ